MTHKHDAVITHLDPDILKCKIKQAFTTNKASRGDGVSASASVLPMNIQD